MGPASSMLASYPARELDKREDSRGRNDKGNREHRPFKGDLSYKKKENLHVIKHVNGALAMFPYKKLG